MSFLAIITIAVIARRLYKFKELGSLAGVQLGTSLFTQSVFNLFNPFGFLVNFPVVYLDSLRWLKRRRRAARPEEAL